MSRILNSLEAITHPTSLWLQLKLDANSSWTL